MTDVQTAGTRPQAGPGPWRDRRVVLALAMGALIVALASLVLVAALDLVSGQVLDLWELEPDLRLRLELTLSMIALVVVLIGGLIVSRRLRQGRIAKASAPPDGFDWTDGVGGKYFYFVWHVSTFLLIVMIWNFLFFIFDVEFDFPWLMFLPPMVVAPETSSYLASNLRSRHPLLWSEIERRAALPRRRGLNAAMVLLSIFLMLLVIAGMLLPKLPLG